MNWFLFDKVTSVSFRKILVLFESTLKITFFWIAYRCASYDPFYSSLQINVRGILKRRPGGLCLASRWVVWVSWSGDNNDFRGGFFATFTFARMQKARAIFEHYWTERKSTSIILYSHKHIHSSYCWSAASSSSPVQVTYLEVWTRGPKTKFMCKSM